MQAPDIGLVLVGSILITNFFFGMRQAARNQQQGNGTFLMIALVATAIVSFEVWSLAQRIHWTS